MSIDDIRRMRASRDLTTEKIVATVERFALPMYRLGTLDAYINQEMKKAAFMSSQIKSDDPVVLKATSRIQGLGTEDQMFLSRQLHRFCQILVLK